jgi:para-nitrobenzyl esterase
VFRVPAVRLADAQSSHAPVYGYEFAWPSPARHGALGACHAIELPFIFGTLAAPGMAAFSGSGPDAERLSGVMMDTWSAFARSGDPSNAADPAVAAPRSRDAPDDDPRPRSAPRARPARPHAEGVGRSAVGREGETLRCT